MRMAETPTHTEVTTAQAGSAEHFALFDSAGNLIDSFTSADDALAVVRGLDEADRDHACVIAFDADGHVI